MQKKLVTLLSVLVILVMVLPMVLTACGGIIEEQVHQNGNQETSAVDGERDPYRLEILNTGMTLTQEQMLSRIKAEYLISNGGYSDNDPVVAIVALPSPSLTERYLADPVSGAADVAEYAASNAGLSALEQIRAEQDALIAELNANGLIGEVKYRYSAVMNAVAVETTFGNFGVIGGMASVGNTILSDTYNRPQSTDASAIINEVDIYETGIFNPGVLDFTGKGTAVAVLDSGFDCDHTVFQHALNPSELLITQQKVAEMLASSNALQLDHSVELMDVYVSNKIPFAFDYADKDSDVYPYDSEHGTHVAGIIGGLDEKITGIAVDTQLVMMKVFPDLDDGGKTEDILAALEDAVRLGVDCINMSLGSSCGFSREVDKVAINEVYDLIGASGISLITAASNSYSSAYGGDQGNTNKVTNPDSGTVGSPSTYHAALSVASISGTKSKYLIGNGQQVIFFNESNSISGKPNDFYAELYRAMGWDPTDTTAEHTIEYVTVPGVGMKANYTGLDVKGKVALIRRGDTTFEDKALQAKNAGAVACIIYNNIEGDILMSMGKTDHIPTVSISKENGTELAKKTSGTLLIKYTQQAGPFMSDFSSWGPTPDLQLKPEITAHGGNILSAVPGGGYDELSGTSMATPNLCGVVVLIRQYLKEKYPERSMQEISVMCNQMLMSTATIILNEEGIPYSPRKQGAGLASLYNVVKTGAYMTVDGIDRSKLEFGDDPERTGVYTKTFNVVNITDQDLSYVLDVIGMTETVSSSDHTFVAEKDQLLNGSLSATASGGGSYVNGTVTVKAGQSVAVTVTYALSASDKAMIDSLFPYGMYVEGFFKLKSTAQDGISLNIPFLAFYGDWTEAPMFDKTYYEVDVEKHDASIDEEDKLKADYYATTPYGSYYYNYIIPLGTYLYDVDTNAYDRICASLDHIAISDSLGTIDGISAVYAGLLRGAKSMEFRITDKVTGEVIAEHTTYNMPKAYSNGGTPIPGYEYLKWKSYQLGLVNNHQYEFTMEGLLDYGDGGATTNVRNSFSFDFYLDNEAPVIKSVSYEKVYDKTLKKDRYYLTMVVYDNHYVQSITPITLTSASSYATLGHTPIPVYGEKGKDCSVRFEITDYLEDLYSGAVITSALAFSIDDYALNSNIFLCQLPGTRGDFKFTSDGTMEGAPMTICSVYEDEIVDLTQFLATADLTVDENKDYLKYLVWSSSNEKIATVQEGQVRGISAGRTTVTVKEAMDLKQATILINVKKRPESEKTGSGTGRSGDVQSAPLAIGNIRLMSANDVDSASSEALKTIRFSYFETLFAYSRAAQTSQIGDTGDRVYISSLEGNTVSFYPGEKIKLFYDMDPWYVADRYAVTFSSTNEGVAVVDQDGVVTALKKGTTNIVLNVEGSNITARLKIVVNSEFIIENRTLIAYKGLGGTVVIPDDEGILYIGAFAFCLYDTDYTVELPDDDFDANKIPAANTTITSIIIPEGVEEVQKYAFYNCSGLQSVTLPSSIKFVREYAFYNNAALKTINLENVQVIGAYAFSGCSSLNGISPEKAYAIGVRAFEHCTSLTSVDLRQLRNTGAEAFRGCTSLSSVVMAEKTKLSEGMFAGSGLRSVDLYVTLEVPAYCFAQCEQLTTVVLHNDVAKIGTGAFCQSGVKSVTFLGTVERIEEQAFYDCDALTQITLPDCDVMLKNYCFFHCDSLAKVIFGEKTLLGTVEASVFQGTVLKIFEIPAANPNYTVSPDGALLLNKAGDTVILAAPGFDFGDYTLPATCKVIGDGAFAGTGILSVTFGNANTVIGRYAFANCESLTTVNFPEARGTVVGDRAFQYATALNTIENFSSVVSAGDYAFANTGLLTVVTGDNVTFGEGAFFRSALTTVTVGANCDFGMGAFQYCTALKTVVMPAAGGVHFGESCFAFDRALAHIDLSTMTEIESETFYFCSSLQDAFLRSAKRIGDYAFADCALLSTMVMDQVESIGEGAFARYDEKGGAPSFTFINLPNTLKVIGDGAFLGCEALKEITIPDSVTELGDFLFSYCVSLESVTLPAGITKIGMYDFAGCTNLYLINLDHITEIADFAFTSCENLAVVKIPVVRSIGYGAFASTSLNGRIQAPALVIAGDYAFQSTYMTGINAPNLAVIGEGAFQGNGLLAEFVFSEQLEFIGSFAFEGCSALKSFCVGAGRATTANIGDYAKLIDGILYIVLPSGRLQLMSVPGGMNLETLEVVENTCRVDIFAGNANPNVKTIILPSTLRIVGAHAFDGYTSLETVEFRSFIAPAWESYYEPDYSLSETDPGYGLLHNQFDFYGLELWYFNFVGLLGTYEPINMILPSNPDAEGYDALPYLVAFGPVGEAERSDYIAMDKTLSNFIEYAAKIAAIRTITLTDETLINNAVAALNAMKQNAVDFGYTAEEWNEMVTTVTKAKAQLTALKLANSSQAAQTLQKKIDALPDVYSADAKAAMKEISELLAALPVGERSVLTLTKYNALLSAYEQDVANDPNHSGKDPEVPGQKPGETEPPKPVEEEEELSFRTVALILIIGLIVMLGIALDVSWASGRKRKGI